MNIINIVIINDNYLKLLNQAANFFYFLKSSNQITLSYLKLDRSSSEWIFGHIFILNLNCKTLNYLNICWGIKLEKRQ